MIKICVFADIHYCDEIPNWPVKRKLVDYAEDLTNKLIDKINNEIKPDIVTYFTFASSAVKFSAALEL